MKGTKLLTIVVTVLVLTTPMAIACASVMNKPVANNVAEDVPDYTSEVGDCSNFASHETVIFKNINEKDVTADVLFRGMDEVMNNPNFSEAVLLQQCIDYKKAHPDEEVTMKISSFHFSIVAAACLDRTSNHFGEMKSLYDCVRDDDGFVRISELLIDAARIGIYVTVIGQLDASETNHGGTWKSDIHFATYFESVLDESCYGDLKDHCIGDFMTFRECQWRSYGDRSAADMMHTKVATVSNYIDYNGEEHQYGLFVTSTNLDGIDGNGYNGYNGWQTGAIITNHYELWNVSNNYLSILTDYCEQEDSVLFREKIIRMNTDQFNIIADGKYSSIKESDKIVYLGSENDSVFKMMFAPFGGSSGAWDEKYNLYCYYLNKLSESDDFVEFIWNNPKYYSDTEVSMSMMELVRDTFIKSDNKNDNLYLHLGYLDESIFDSLIGHNGTYNINETMGLYSPHSKDLQLSYIDDNERHYVSMLNSLNIHYGSMYYQSNHLLVIDETDSTSPLFYTAFKELTTL